MTEFTPVSAVIGGALIGAAAGLLFRANGRIAGVSGIVGGLLRPATGEAGWRVAFAFGMVASVAGARWLAPQAMDITITGSLPLLIVGGLLVGVGTQVGGGCTSGHGVCGSARLQRRSIVATAIFMAAAIATVAAVRLVAGAG